MSYRFAIIGCGRIAQRHARHIAARASLAAVCDIVPAKAAELATAYGAKFYDSPEKMLAIEKPDVVSICTPNGLHAPHALLALAAGCHVLCEKPMCLSTASGREMIAAANNAGKKLFVVKQNRYNPPVQVVKQLLEEGKLGTIHSFQVNCFWNRPVEYYRNTWHGTTSLDGGTLYTQFSHFVDLLWWLLGDVSSVGGMRSNYMHGNSIEFEDTGMAWLQLQNGAMGTLQYTVNSYQRNMEGSITIFGSAGTVKIGGQYLNELEFFSVEGQSIPALAPGNPANQYGFYEGSMSNHDKVYDNLLRALEDPNHHFLEAAEALKSVDIIERIYAGSRLIP